VIIHNGSEDGYWAEVPALPGCITEGETKEELMANLQDAIQGWLDVANMRDTNEPAETKIDIAV